MLFKLGLAFFHLLSWCGIVHILLTKRDPRSALGWAGLILLVPVLGLLLYLLFGIGRTQSRAAAIMRKQASLLPTYAHPPRKDVPPEIPRYLLQMERMGRHLTSHHLVPGNSVEPLFNGNEAYPRMLAAIERAREQIFLVTYIFNNGEVSARFCEALIAAARRGVEVRVLLDGIGRFYSLRSPLSRLEANGVKIASFLPPRLFPPNFMINLRNHRKIMVCDDVAYTGGMNIADYHVVEPGKKNAAQDVHYECRGAIVREFCRAFLLDWGFATNNYDARVTSIETAETAETAEAGSCWCRLVMDGPGTSSDPLNELMAGSMVNAEMSVTVMTPYFLPTREIMTALRIAAEKGVDVRVILPAKNNLPYMHWASFRVLPELLRAGVRVYFQPPPFAHTKLLCVDDYYCQIGSANFDSRSLRLNFELNSEVFDRDFNGRMTHFCREVMARSKEIRLEDIMAMPLLQRLRSSLFWLFSPYL